MCILFSKIFYFVEEFSMFNLYFYSFNKKRVPKSIAYNVRLCEKKHVCSKKINLIRHLNQKIR